MKSVPVAPAALQAFPCRRLRSLAHCSASCVVPRSLPDLLPNLLLLLLPPADNGGWQGAHNAAVARPDGASRVRNQKHQSGAQHERDCGSAIVCSKLIGVVRRLDECGVTRAWLVDITQTAMCGKVTHNMACSAALLVCLCCWDMGWVGGYCE